jgi:thiol-disulfide isomerase/thioredoxin
MADRIAGFLFGNAVILMPAVIVVCLAATVVLVRRWPARLWRRVISGVASLVLIAVMAIAGGLLYLERNIRSIIAHRVDVLTLHPRNGNTPARLADLRGKVVLVNFWATWCMSCRAELPDMNRLAARFPSDRVAVMTITDEPDDRVVRFEQKVTALRTLEARFESDQPRGALALMAYQGRPTTVIVGVDGRVRDIFIGEQSYQTLERALVRAL